MSACDMCPSSIRRRLHCTIGHWAEHASSCWRRQSGCQWNCRDSGGGGGGGGGSGGAVFDVVVIDEAAQALEAECWIPMLMGMNF